MHIKQTILLIEDRPQIIAHFTAIFKGQYPLLFASTASESITVFMQNKHIISAIWINHIIHNESSFQIVSAVTKINPYQPIILYGPETLSNDIHQMLKLDSVDYIDDIFNLENMYGLMNDCCNEVTHSTRILKLSRRLFSNWLTTSDLMHRYVKKTPSQKNTSIVASEQLNDPMFNHLAQAHELLIFSESSANNAVISYWLQHKYIIHAAQTVADCMSKLQTNLTVKICVFHIDNPNKNLLPELIQLMKDFPAVSFIAISNFMVPKEILKLYKHGILDVISRPFIQKSIANAIDIGIQTHNKAIIAPRLVLDLFHSLFDTATQLRIVVDFVNTKKQYQLPVFIAELIQFYPKLTACHLPYGFELPAHLVDEKLIQFIRQMHLRFSHELR